MIELRPRQVKAIDDLRTVYSLGYRAPLLRASTGFGKTATAVCMIQSALGKGLRVWFLAHLQEILNDTAKRLSSEGIRYSWIMGDLPHDRRLSVQLVSVQSAINRLARLEKPDLIIIDESHLAVASTYQEIFKWAKAGPKFYDDTGSKLLHLTATPRRLGGEAMGEVADIIVETCSTRELINEGLLCPVRYLTPDTPDMAGIAHSGTEFSVSAASELMTKPKLVGNALDHYMEFGRGRAGVGFCPDIRAANVYAEEFKRAGLRTLAVSGESDDVLRLEAQEGLQNGRLDFVFNCKLWVAGVDISRIGYIADLAPTESLTRYLQGLGRGLRTDDDKDDLMYSDHAGNFYRHGDPLAEREWNLKGAGNGRLREAQEVPVKQCPKCFAYVKSADVRCLCGHVFVPKRREIEQVEGTLKEVSLEQDAPAEKKPKNDGQWRFQTQQELEAEGRRRGIKRPALWARAVMIGRAKRDDRLKELRRG